MTTPTQRNNDNVVVEVWFQIEKDAEGYPKSRDAEGLLCKPLDVECSQCQVNSIPFYLNSVAYGDTISTSAHPGGYLQFKEVLKRGGYSIYRIFLHDSTNKERWITELLDFDVLLEQDGNLIAMAVAPSVDSDALVDYILAGKAKGLWGAQDGYILEEPDAS